MRSMLIGIIAFALAVPAATAQEAVCTLTPLSLPLFDATPVAQLATPTGTPSATTLSAEEAAGVLEEYAACINTGDPTLAWAIFSPRWFGTTFADPTEHYLPAFEQELAAGVVPVTDPLSLLSVDAIAETGDGRVAVTATFVGADQQWTDTLVLVNYDGQWLIDEVMPATQSHATLGRWLAR